MVIYDPFTRPESKNARREIVRKLICRGWLPLFAFRHDPIHGIPTSKVAPSLLHDDQDVRWAPAWAAIVFFRFVASKGMTAKPGWESTFQQEIKRYENNPRLQRGLYVQYLLTLPEGKTREDAFIRSQKAESVKNAIALLDQSKLDKLQLKKSSEAE